MKIQEMAQYTYSLEEVLKEVEKLSVNYSPSIGEVYHTFVGRADQPGVYDKRSCLVVGVEGDNIFVYKLVKNIKDSLYRSNVLDYEEVNLSEKRQIDIRKTPYKIDKKWLRTFDGTLSSGDYDEYRKKLQALKRQGFFK